VIGSRDGMNCRNALECEEEEKEESNQRRRADADAMMIFARVLNRRRASLNRYANSRKKEVRRIKNGIVILDGEK
jgi:hypothetical protein